MHNNPVRIIRDHVALGFSRLVDLTPFQVGLPGLGHSLLDWFLGWGAKARCEGHCPAVSGGGVGYFPLADTAADWDGKSAPRRLGRVEVYPESPEKRRDKWRMKPYMKTDPAA